MKKSFFLLLVILCFGGIGCKKNKKKECRTPKKEVARLKKKVIIFSSMGGGGHVSSAEGISHALGEEYEISICYPFRELLTNFDPIKYCSFNYLNCEEFYNKLLTGRWNWWIHRLVTIGEWRIRMHHTTLENQIRNYLTEENPDLVITVIPLINGCITRVAAELEKPCLLIPTDLEIETFLHDLPSPTPKSFHLCLPFRDDYALNKARNAGVPDSAIHITGCPLRSSFLSKKPQSNVRTEFKIPYGKQIIMILMGARGSSGSYLYAKELAKLKNPAHLIFCLGKNEELRPKIEKINWPSHISYSIFGFTNRISDLMNISDLLITKTGSVSVCEAIYSNIPMLLDKTVSSCLAWERYNLAFISERGFGSVIHRRREITKKVDHLLANRNELAQMRKNLINFEKPEFEKMIKELLRTKIFQEMDGILT